MSAFWAVLREVRSRFINSNMSAFDLGLYAHRWRFFWRFAVVQLSHDHTAPSTSAEGVGPFRLYLFTGKFKSQLGEFCEATCK